MLDWNDFFAYVSTKLDLTDSMVYMLSTMVRSCNVKQKISSRPLVMVNLAFNPYSNCHIILSRGVRSSNFINNTGI